MHGTFTVSPSPTASMRGNTILPPLPTEDHLSAPYDALAALSRMAHRKQQIEEMLKSEREKNTPNAATIAACESWLGVYAHERARLVTATSSRLRHIAEDQ